MTDKGKIFSIVRTSTHDGIGIRTVVYFKGCSLKCAWCHNPEGISFDNEIMFYGDKCIGCKRCTEICPEHHKDGGYIRSGCTVCGRCVELCPNEALVMCGKNYDSDALLKVIVKDSHYYDISGGGVTFSGGECFLQHDFLKTIARKCKAAGIHTAAESALNFDTSYLDVAVEDIDDIFADLKHMDSGIHKKYTGCGNELILKNIRYLSENHGNITVRIPLIPSVNDSDDNMRKTAEFINSCGSGIKCIELLKYNDLATNKYNVLGKTGNVFRAIPQTDDFMKYKCDLLYDLVRSTVKVKY